MKSRYLGNDNGLRMIADASNSVGETAVAATNAASNSVRNHIQQQIELANVLMQQQRQLSEAEAQAATQKSTGLAGLVQSVGAVVGQVNASNAAKEQAKAKAQQAALVQQQANNEVAATEVNQRLGRQFTGREDAVEGKLRGRLLEQELYVATDGASQLPPVLAYGEEGSRRVQAAANDSENAFAKGLGVRRVEQQKKVATEDDLKAADELNDISNLYWEQNLSPTQYKTEVGKVLAKYQNMSDEGRKGVLLGANEFATKLVNRRTDRTQAEYDKVQVAQADTQEQLLTVKLTQSFSQLANAGVDVQAQPIMDGIVSTLNQWISEPTNTLPMSAKLATGARLLKLMVAKYADKSDKWQVFRSSTDRFLQFSQGYSQATLQLNVDSDRAAFDQRVGLLKLKYGDWTKDVSTPDETQKRAQDAAQLANEQQKLYNQSQQQVGTSYKFSDASLKYYATSAILDPGFEAAMAERPEGKNPAIVTAIAQAKRYRQYEAANADLARKEAATGVKLLEIDTRKAGNVAEFLKQGAILRNKANKSTQEQSILQATERIVRENPALAPFYQQLLSSDGKGTVDLGTLQQALDLEQSALDNTKKGLQSQLQTERNALFTEYQDLYDAGLLDTRDNLRSLRSSYKITADRENEQLRTMMLQQATTQAPAPAYGAQSSFSNASAYAGVTDAKGNVKVVQRAFVSTVNYQGKQVLTPMQFSVASTVTSRYEDSRPGGRKHAGIDLKANNGETAVALVSGTAYVFTGKRGYGGHVDIVADNGFTYRYGHQAALVKSGQRVYAGQNVSRSDGSGTGDPHLHLEVITRPAEYDSSGNYRPRYEGIAMTTEPLAHLAQLTNGSPTVLKPRLNAREVQRLRPTQQSPANAVQLPQGAAVSGGRVQTANASTSKPAANVYNNQRPIKITNASFNSGTRITYDNNDDYGYAELRRNQPLRLAITQAAKQLKVPGHWIADIIRQESGGFRANAIHNGGSNYGLFGFGEDSFSDVSMSQIRRMSDVQQVQLLVKYMNTNVANGKSWLQHQQAKGGNVTIAEFWGVLRMGYNMRKQVLANPYASTSIRLGDTKQTYGNELKLLGKHVGRRYDVNNRSVRNKAIDDKAHAGCKACNSLLASGSGILPHTHDSINDLA